MAFVNNANDASSSSVFIVEDDVVLRDELASLLELDKTIVFHFYDFVLVLSVVFSRCQLYSVSLSQRKLIPNSALFILPFREFYA